MARSDGLTAQARVQFQLLGGLAVGRDGEPLDLGGRKQRAVLAILALHAGRAVTADRLIDRVWGDAAPPRADSSLQAYVSKLRRLLDPDRSDGAPGAIVTEAGGYRLVTDGADVDLVRFHDLVAEGDAALAAGDPAAAVDRYDAALSLYQPVLPEFAGELWVTDAVARAEAAHADALDGSFGAKLALGGGSDLVAGLEVAVAAHPFRERLRGDLALALYRAGRQTDALRSLAAARQTLADEIGIEPGPELRKLEADILAQAPHLVPPDTRRSTERPPVESVARAHPIGPDGTVGLVGRDGELAALLDAAHRAAAGEGRAVVIDGEPGIGKTRLVEELVAALPGVHRGDGPVVAWARCQEDAASAPFWGYTQIAEQILAAGVIGDDARARISAAGGGVHTIDLAADRLALHSSMVAALRSTHRPIVIVVDDLQWADPSSLRVLEFVAGSLATLPVLLVATVRSTGPEASSPPLVACLAEVARQPGSRRIDLVGLSPAEVAVWLARRRGERGERADAGDAGLRARVLADPGTAETARRDGDDVAWVVHERTGGNPFFVGEMVELLAREGGLADVTAAQGTRVPAAALDVVRRRVSLLPAATQQLLASASVLGLSIELDVLARVVGLTASDALETLDPAVELGLLTEDGHRPGRLRFAHALVSDALAAELSLARRARLHAAVLDALEDVRSATLDEHLPALVHHAREGALAGAAPRAFDYAVRAARAAGDQAAFEVAASYWGEAQALLDLARPGDLDARYDVLVELGRARLRTDDLTGSQEALLEAISVADAMDDPGAARRAAGALAATTMWQTSPYGQVNDRLVGALQRVVDRLDATPTAERARLVGALADATYYEPDPSRSLELSREALDIARRSNDPDALAQALGLRLRALSRPLPVDERASLAEEMVGLAERRLVGAGHAALAHISRAAVALERADRSRFESDRAHAHALAERAHLPGLLSEIRWAEVFWLAALGRSAEAVQLARETHRVYRRTRGWNADDILLSFELAFAHDRGELASLGDQTSALLAGSFGDAARELLAWMLAESRELERARELVGPVGSVPEAPPDWLWLVRTTAAAHVRAMLGDRRACRVLRDRLAPFAGRMDIGAGPFFGGADLALAALSEALGDLVAARRHAAAAVATLEAMDTRPALARALVLQGRVLAHAGGPDGRARAAAAHARARALATELGLVPVLVALDGVGSAGGSVEPAGIQAGSKHAPG